MGTRFSVYLKRHPERAGRDLEVTRKACRKFEHYPVAIMNFAEGTRFMRQKHQRQASPYRHLLEPHAGGVNYVLALLGKQIHWVYDFTIYYPGEGSLSLWTFLSGKRRRARVLMRRLPLPEPWRRLSLGDASMRAEVASWLASVWRDKDDRIEAGMWE